MLNKSGITSQKMTSPRQILANVELQSSVGCIVDKTMGVDVGDKKIVKAGTPLNIDLMNIQAKCKKPVAAENSNPAIPMNAVLLHDVDVTKADANGTALIFGFINVNRVDTDVAALITAARAIDGASTKLTFMKV